MDKDKPKFRIIKIRGKEYMMLPGVRIPSVYFYPDTPEKVVWMDPT